ncbi:hypothetical protein HDU79_005793 [Rhizoclosmatium sp. JEL0117]|nr:hypothetical protein HDU79_005793 [Rhizoclosmatium sp. JEL0117]
MRTAIIWQDTGAISTCIASTALTSFELLGALYLVFMEREGRKKLTAFNVSLGISAVSVILANICLILGIAGNHDRRKTGSPYFFEVASIATFQMCYIYVCWSRSKGTAKMTSPTLFRTANVLVILAPIACYMQVIPLILYYFLDASYEFKLRITANMSSVFAGVFASTFDSILLTTFVTFLFRNRLETEEISKDAYIAAQHGILANTLSFIAVGLYCASLLFGKDGDWQNMIVSGVLFLCQSIVLNWVVMKFRLHKLEEQEDSVIVYGRNSRGEKYGDIVKVVEEEVLGRVSDTTMRSPGS